ncbi:MAG: UbiX family flavin prenyltransferase [Acidobacteriota bacterium]
MRGEYIVGVTGASGAVVSVGLLRALVCAPELERIHLVFSTAGLAVTAQELDAAGLTAAGFVERFLDRSPRVVSYRNDQIAAPFASGSHPVSGMVIVPCSMNTLGAVAGGLSPNLITRAADVMLKERLPLLLAVRETPLGATHIENMLRATRAGAMIFPVCPAYYIAPTSVAEITDHFVMRLLDHLGVPASTGKRWGSPPTAR